MISLPLLHSLDVTDYGLYPGDDPATPGLHIRFVPGLTLVLGANGIGKTTLVMMLYRLLTGPSDIPALLRDTDLGTASLEVSALRPAIRRTFAQRVADRAAKASARLLFYLGSEEVAVERDLRDLTLRSFSVGNATFADNEQQYQEQMARLANVSTFGDWILLLRYIVFYFEDRRSLVWDPSAQRHLLRILFLERNEAQYWKEREREILEIDSRVRNIRSVTTGMERDMARDESLTASEPEIREELGRLESEQRIDDESLDEISSNLADIEAHHENSRLRFLTLQQDRESLYRGLERAELHAVNARLPGLSDSARYILAQLLAEAKCLACGNSVPGVMESLKSRLHGGGCIVCGSNLIKEKDQAPIDLAEERIGRQAEDLQEIDAEIEAARRAFDEAEVGRNRTHAKIQELRAAIANRRARVDMLLDRLPLAESQMYERRRELASLRAEIQTLRHELGEKRESFARIIREANATMEEQTSEVQESFSDYARDFLFEDCRLLWAPNPARLGQTGRRFDFPAFALELGGSDFSSTLRRSGPDDVSESQREFIDISFRLALVKVAAQDGVTSLIMDAPESSLDAVFVDRATSILGKFGRREEDNRLVVTSNLVDGNLIPTLLTKSADEDDRSERVVDLLKMAAPTAALLTLGDEYDKAKRSLLGEANVFV